MTIWVANTKMFSSTYVIVEKKYIIGEEGHICFVSWDGFASVSFFYHFAIQLLSGCRSVRDNWEKFQIVFQGTDENDLASILQILTSRAELVFFCI